jgi:TRAP-type C4-dicarboxylate transport system substrate-binding protein
VVDSQENPVGILVPVQIWQYHKHVTMWNYLADPLIIYWGKRAWKKLPQDIKKAILEAAIASARFEKALCRSGLDGDKSHNILQNEFNYNMKVPDPVTFMRDKGMTVTFLTDDEIKIFAQATRSIYDKWVPKIGKEVYQKAKADMGK